MRPNQSESPSDVWRWFQNQAESLGPAVLGSLSLRRSPCVRENCRACQSGEQHPSYVLYGRLKGRRFAVYVPEELVPEVRRCLDNGRALQELLFQAAPRYVKALKRERDQASKKKGELKSAENCDVPDQFRRLGVAPARPHPGAAAAGHLRFSGRPKRDDRSSTTRSATRFEKAGDGSQRVNSAAGSARLHTDARQVMVRLQKRGVAVQGVHFIKVFERATPHYE